MIDSELMLSRDHLDRLTTRNIYSVGTSLVCTLVCKSGQALKNRCTRLDELGTLYQLYRFTMFDQT